MRGQPPQLVETLPHPSVHMTFERGRKSEVRGPSRAKFSGFLERKGRVFAVKFRPGGFYPCVRGAVSQFTDAVMSIKELFGPQGLNLARTVLSSDNDSSCIAAVESFLKSRCPQADENVTSVSEIVYSV